VSPSFLLNIDPVGAALPDRADTESRYVPHPRLSSLTRSSISEYGHSFKGDGSNSYGNGGYSDDLEILESMITRSTKSSITTTTMRSSHCDITALNKDD
jgi:hypothetical protein